jgi:fructokinase
MQVLSIGEILWDIFPNQELLGGAALNFSANIQRLGDSAGLLTAVGDDPRGRAAYKAMQQLGLATDFVQTATDLATGVAQVNTTSDGEPSFEIPRPAAFDRLSMTADLRDAAFSLGPDWLYFGTLLQIEPHVEEMTAYFARSLPGVRCFYDMNLRPRQWNFPLVQRLCELASVLKLNEAEAQTLGELEGTSSAAFSLESFCRVWASKYNIDAICVTLGGAGCCVYENQSAVMVPGFPVAVEDTVGAGDAFAAAFLHGYHRGWPTLLTARFANALGSIVASRAGATPAWSVEECFGIASISRNGASN